MTVLAPQFEQALIFGGLWPLVRGRLFRCVCWQGSHLTANGWRLLISAPQDSQDRIGCPSRYCDPLQDYSPINRALDRRGRALCAIRHSLESSGVPNCRGVPSGSWRRLKALLRLKVHISIRRVWSASPQRDALNGGYPFAHSVYMKTRMASHPSRCAASQGLDAYQPTNARNCRLIHSVWAGQAGCRGRP